MELIISVALILIITVGLSELREWRSSQKFKKLELLLKGERRALASLADQHKALSEAFEKLSDSLTESSEKHGADFESLSKAIDVHGIRLNYKPGALAAPDFVEGL